MIGRLDRNAMTVVSMENFAFDHDYLTGIIKTCAKFHSQLFIVLADDLYTYNRDLFHEPPNRIFRLKRDRRRYIENAIQRSSSEAIKIIFKSWRQLCTPRFVDVFRRVYMLILQDCALLRQVTSRAVFLSDMQPKSTKRMSNLLALSRAYIIEETAMALYLASKYGIADEYYPGDDAPVLRATYDLLDTQNLYAHLKLRSHEKRFWNVEVGTNRFDRTLEWANSSGRFEL